MISRHFVTIEGRKVHYRRCGQGPALVLLHASPVSSKVFEPMMRFHAHSFTCFAFDTPGNGLSDPLQLEDPDMADYAKAQAKTLSALGIRRAIAYGRHTGASIAASMAERRPDLIAMAMTDGYPVFSKEERANYLSGYLNDLPIEADGSHLSWLWNRYRDQFLFWPWNKKQIDNLADCDMPGIEFIHNGVIALMEAGNNYKAPYRAVFKHDAMATLENADVPICVAARPGDSLFTRFQTIPDKYWKEDIPRAFPEACIRELELMSPHMPDIDAPQIDPSDPIGGVRDGFFSSGADQLHFVEKKGKGRPLTLIAPAPGSLDSIKPMLDAMADDRHVIAIEPAGCGDSDAPSDADCSIDRQADRIVECVRAFGLVEGDFAGWSAGGAIAIEVARRCQAQSVVLCDPLLVDDEIRGSLVSAYSKDASPKMDGRHFSRLWREVREGELFFPWFDGRRRASRSENIVDLDPERLTRKTLMLAKHASNHAALWHAAWSYPWADRITNYPGAVTLLHTKNSIIPPDRIIDLPNIAKASCGATPTEVWNAILRALES